KAAMPASMAAIIINRDVEKPNSTACFGSVGMLSRKIRHPTPSRAASRKKPEIELTRTSGRFCWCSLLSTRSVSSSAGNDGEDGAGEDEQVEPDRPVANVIFIQL